MFDWYLALAAQNTGLALAVLILGAALLAVALRTIQIVFQGYGPSNSSVKLSSERESEKLAK